jgi:hypothetical protein
VGLERGPLSPEKLLKGKSSASRFRKLRLMVVGIRCADNVIDSTHKTGTVLPTAAVAQSVYFACGVNAAEFVLWL